MPVAHARATAPCSAVAPDCRCGTGSWRFGSIAVLLATAIVVMLPAAPVRAQAAGAAPAAPAVPAAPTGVPAPGTASVTPADADSVTLNFVNADIDAVVKAVADIAGRNFLVDPRVKGTVNIVSARPVPKSLV